MQKRSLGATGLELSEIVFGAGAVGGAVFRPPPEQRLEIVRRALDLGIDWIDTAPSYGQGQSEENLGWILRQLGARPRISTKVRIDPARSDDIPGQIERSLCGSLERLGRDRVELIQLHNWIGAETDARRLGLDSVLGPKGVAEGFERVREQGLARLAGFTGFGDTRALREVVSSGRFDTVQAYYNILNPSAGQRVPAGFPGQDFERLIDLAASRGLGVLVIRSLSAGALVGPDHAHPAGRRTPGSDAEVDGRNAEAVAEALGCPDPAARARAAVRFALGHRGVSGVVVGFSELSHVESAVQAAREGPLDADALARLDALHRSGFRAGAA